MDIEPAPPQPAVAPPPAPKRDRRRIRTRLLAVRCTPEEWDAIHAAAARAGLSTGAFMRHQALGTAGPRSARRPPVEKAELVRLLGAVGRLGSNVNQIARVLNADGVVDPPAFAEATSDVAVMRAAIMRALGRAPGRPGP